MSEIEYELWELDAHRAVPTPDGEPVDPYNQERCSADEADNAFIRDITGTLVDMTPVTMRRVVDAWNLCADHPDLDGCVVVEKKDVERAIRGLKSLSGGGFNVTRADDMAIDRLDSALRGDE